MPTTPLDTSTMANAIRALAMDAVQQANSGHPGALMGLAEAAVRRLRALGVQAELMSFDEPESEPGRVY
mgnify:CR=1 FL=1